MHGDKLGDETVCLGVCSSCGVRRDAGRANGSDGSADAFDFEVHGSRAGLSPKVNPAKDAQPRSSWSQKPLHQPSTDRWAWRS